MNGTAPPLVLGGASDRSAWLRTWASQARRITGGWPQVLVIAGALLALGLAYVGSFVLRFEFRIPRDSSKS